MNTNRVATDGFSNPESERLFKDMQGRDGPQCGGCSFFAPFNLDYGMCCHAGSRHFLETVFEHFSCPALVYEGWGAHSFSTECRVDESDGEHVSPEQQALQGLPPVPRHEVSAPRGPQRPWWRFW